MDNNSVINKIIDNSHFSDINKIYKLVKQTIPDITKKQIKKILDARHKDRYMKEWQTKPYQVKIFSAAPNTYFHDLLDNGVNNDPRYYHIFIRSFSRKVPFSRKLTFLEKSRPLRKVDLWEMYFSRENYGRLFCLNINTYFYSTLLTMKHLLAYRCTYSLFLLYSLTQDFEIWGTSCHHIKVIYLLTILTTQQVTSNVHTCETN